MGMRRNIWSNESWRFSNLTTDTKPQIQEAQTNTKQDPKKKKKNVHLGISELQEIKEKNLSPEVGKTHYPQRNKVKITLDFPSETM